LVQNAVLTLLLVVMGLALLYAYRSQTPSVQTVAVTQAIQDIHAGRVRSAVISGNRASLELTNGSREQTFIQQPDEIFAKAILDYNATNPAQKVDLRYEQESQTLPVIGSIILSLLPVLLIGGFFYYMMVVRSRDRR
jgi:ATP-dependent Zn protease